jgi:hypothetical protein
MSACIVGFDDLDKAIIAADEIATNHNTTVDVYSFVGSVKRVNEYEGIEPPKREN